MYGASGTIAHSPAGTRLTGGDPTLWLRCPHRDRRRCPLAADHRIIGPVHAQGQIETAGRGRQPVAFLIAAWRLVLDVEIERAIGVELQSIAIANSETLDRVRGKVAVIVIESERPESPHRRNLALLKMHGVKLGALKSLAAGVMGRRNIDGIFRR